MLKIIQQLKQQNPSAFSFALAGMVALFFSVTGLALLGNGLIEQKQIAKQVGDLQITGRSIESIVVTNRLTCGEEAAFAEFEKSVNSFNQQWTDFKQQHNYSAKTIKEIDTVWQRINRNAQRVLSKKNDMMVLKLALDDMLLNLKPMHKMSEDLVNVLLSNQADAQQIVIAKEVSIFLIRIEREIKSIYIGDENAVISEDNFGDRSFEKVAIVLNGFLSGDQNEGIKQIEDEKIREIIKNEMILYKKIDSHANTILKMSPMLFQVREAEAAIYRNVPELKPALIKLNNHKLNTGLMVLTLCSWLCVFACGYGYVRALKTR